MRTRERYDSAHAQDIFNPASIAGLKMWLDASYLAGSEGNPVTTWTDRSGLGNSPTQATGSLKPLYRAAGLNSQPCLQFDGVDDQMLLLSPVSTVIDNYTMVLVCRSDYGSTNACAPLFVGTGSTNGWGISTATDTNFYGQLRGGVAWDSTTAAEDTAANILILERAGSVTTLYKNGAALAPTFGPAPAAPTTATKLGLHDVAGSFFNGVMAQALVFEAALTAQNRADLNALFGERYGITVS